MVELRLGLYVYPHKSNNSTMLALSKFRTKTIQIFFFSEKTLIFSRFNKTIMFSDRRGRGGGERTFNRGDYGGGNGYGGGDRSFGGGFASGGQSFGGGGGYGGGRWANNFGPSRQTDWSATPPIQKNFYREDPTIAARNQGEIDQWLHDNQCTLNGENIPRPIFEFSESGFPKPIVELLYKNYQRPTVIQSISWPVALSGRDMISIAKTGSGKTLGFILPAIVHTLNQPKRQAGDGPSIVVLLPTRELAVQVEEVTREYCKVMQLEATCCYGGAPKTNQQRDLRRGVDICIATPGRLLDFMNNSTTNMHHCTYLVLDEADRMLDMGFEPQIRRIVDQIRPDRQTLMFSATWPRDVRALAADFHQNPVHLNVGSLELAANHNIYQYVEVIDEYRKPERLLELLDQMLNEKDCKALIFVETKRKADELTRNMRRDGWPALCIHGDKEQREREWVLSEFKAGKTPILLATDVAARGLDVNDIKYVINYDYPNNSEDYVHRIGRTGRQEKTGTSYTFFTPNNAPKARDLIKVLEEAQQEVPAQLRNLTSNSFNGYSGGRSRYRQTQAYDKGPAMNMGWGNGGEGGW